MYGVIGACESSATIAKDLTCAAGAPDHDSGGLIPPWQVNWLGMAASEPNAGLVTVIGGCALTPASVSPPSKPQPLTSGARTTSVTADASPRQHARPFARARRPTHADLRALSLVAGKCRA